MTKKTHIGVSMNYTVTEHGTERAYIDRGYIDAITAMDAIPHPIAIHDNIDDLPNILDRIDGLLITGGLDLNPARWNEKQHPKTELVHPRREWFDEILYNAARQKQLPILGICLGLQLINVIHGGTLYQHLPESPNRIDHGGEFNHTQHNVKLHPQSRLRTLTNADTTLVPSSHHQGINTVGKDLIPAAVADDGVTEAIELLDYPFLLAVQWHPEKSLDTPFAQAIFKSFLNAAKS